ncbi:hypothetical protein AAMO2058_000281000 [Amorphochlora amoebiformis]
MGACNSTAKLEVKRDLRYATAMPLMVTAPEVLKGGYFPCWEAMFDPVHPKYKNGDNTITWTGKDWTWHNKGLGLIATNKTTPPVSGWKVKLANVWDEDGPIFHLAECWKRQRHLLEESLLKSKVLKPEKDPEIGEAQEALEAVKKKIKAAEDSEKKLISTLDQAESKKAKLSEEQCKEFLNKMRRDGIHFESKIMHRLDGLIVEARYRNITDTLDNALEDGKMKEDIPALLAAVESANKRGLAMSNKAILRVLDRVGKVGMARHETCKKSILEIREKILELFQKYSKEAGMANLIAERKNKLEKGVGEGFVAYIGSFVSGLMQNAEEKDILHEMESIDMKEDEKKPKEAKGSQEVQIEITDTLKAFGDAMKELQKLEDILNKKAQVYVEGKKDQEQFRKNQLRYPMQLARRYGTLFLTRTAWGFGKEFKAEKKNFDVKTGDAEWHILEAYFVDFDKKPRKHLEKLTKAIDNAVEMWKKNKTHPCYNPEVDDARRFQIRLNIKLSIKKGIDYDICESIKKAMSGQDILQLKEKAYIRIAKSILYEKVMGALGGVFGDSADVKRVDDLLAMAKIAGIDMHHPEVQKARKYKIIRGLGAQPLELKRQPTTGEEVVGKMAKPQNYEFELKRREVIKAGAEAPCKVCGGTGKKPKVKVKEEKGEDSKAIEQKAKESTEKQAKEASAKKTHEKQSEVDKDLLTYIKGLVDKNLDLRQVINEGKKSTYGWRTVLEEYKKAKFDRDTKKDSADVTGAKPPQVKKEDKENKEQDSKREALDSLIDKLLEQKADMRQVISEGKKSPFGWQKVLEEYKKTKFERENPKEKSDNKDSGLKVEKKGGKTEEKKKTDHQICQTCDGTGKFNKFLDTYKVTSDDGLQCTICYADSEYGVSAECMHFFCSDCIKMSLEAILDQGQFPAYCPACRAETPPGVPNPVQGKICGKALTFLQRRGVISRQLQFRIMKQQMEKGEKEFFECPNGCGNFLIPNAPVFDTKIVQGKTGPVSKTWCKPGVCECGQLFCMLCKATMDSDKVDEHLCADKRNIKMDEKTKEMMKKLGKPCPNCGNFIEKIGGCDTMMCGGHSHGKIVQAIKNGGCGHQFFWSTGKPASTSYIGWDGKTRSGFISKEERLKAMEVAFGKKFT